MIYIGSNSHSLYDALSAHYNSNIRSSDAFYLALDLPAETLSDDLSAILLERLLPKLLLNVIAGSEAASPEEQEYLTDAVSSEIIRNGIAEELRNKLSRTIRMHLSENSRINIEGLLYFRLRNDLSAFCRSIEDCVSRFHDLYEKNRLLLMLRRYVCGRSPQTDFLRVIGSAADYRLLDGDGRTIRCIFSEDYTPEEHLLNSLLYLSPAMLDLSALDHPELCDVLEEIFSDRLI